MEDDLKTRLELLERILADYEARYELLEAIKDLKEEIEDINYQLIKQNKKEN